MYQAKPGERQKEAAEAENKAKEEQTEDTTFGQLKTGDEFRIANINHKCMLIHDGRSGYGAILLEGPRRGIVFHVSTISGVQKIIRKT